MTTGRRLSALRRAARRWGRAEKPGGELKTMEPRQGPVLQDAFAECAGKWVAVDRRTQEVLAADETAYALSAQVRRKGLRGIELVRVPAADEPEVVSFG